MSIGFRVRASRAFWIAGLAITVAGCATLRPAPEAAPPPVDTADSGTARTYLSLAELREDKSDWSGAQGVVEKGLAQRPGNQALSLRRAQILLHRAASEDESAMREEARATLAPLADLADAEARMSLAWLDFADGQRDDAIAAAHAAADSDPTSSRMQRILGSSRAVTMSSRNNGNDGA